MARRIWCEHEPVRVRARLTFDPSDSENQRIVAAEITWHGHRYVCKRVLLYYRDPPGDNPDFHYFDCYDEVKETSFRIRFDVKTQLVNVVGEAGPYFDSDR